VYLSRRKPSETSNLGSSTAAGLVLDNYIPFPSIYETASSRGQGWMERITVQGHLYRTIEGNDCFEVLYIILRQQLCLSLLSDLSENKMAILAYTLGVLLAAAIPAYSSLLERGLLVLVNLEFLCS
jgi:hypothetical protein